MNLLKNLLGGHCFGSSMTRRITGGKITTFKPSHPVLTMAYFGVCSPNVSVRMAWIFFGVLPYRKKNLMTARVSMLLKSHASPDMLSFRLCNKKKLAIQHMNRHLFPKTLSIPSYDMESFLIIIQRRCVCFWRDSPQWVRASSLTSFLDHTQRRMTIGRTPLVEWAARGRTS